MNKVVDEIDFTKPIIRRKSLSASNSGNMTTTVEFPEFFSMTFDEPVKHGGEGKGPSPLQGVLASLCGCEAVTFNRTAKDMDFSFNQIDIAKYYKLYENLMEFWHKQFPKKIYDFNYEKLTENQEEQTRKLFDYLGLKWDKEVLNFHRNQRAVKTASSDQVRKNIYKGSSNEWKKYKKWLIPMSNYLNIN